VLEAMAMGRPIITTNTPGCRQTVEEGKNGFLVPIKNSEALYQAMLRFVNNPILIQAMGKASLTMARVKFDVIKINKDMLTIMKLI
jgi:glycosyltransferase involved in cell wall biosynthesis